MQQQTAAGNRRQALSCECKQPHDCWWPVPNWLCASPAPSAVLPPPMKGQHLLPRCPALPVNAAPMSQAPPFAPSPSGRVPLLCEWWSGSSAPHAQGRTPLTPEHIHGQQHTGRPTCRVRGIDSSSIVKDGSLLLLLPLLTCAPAPNTATAAAGPAVAVH
jgi:hypothetical protein